MEQIKRLAVIPARGGSKRIQEKNIKKLLNYPIVVHTLKALSDSKLFSELYVSTDCEKIFGTVSQFGFQPRFKRLEGLSDDFTPLMPVLKSAVNQYYEIGMSFDEVWLIMPCSPLLEPEDYRMAADFFKLNNERPLLSIVEFPAPVEWSFDKLAGSILRPRDPGKFSLRSQDLRSSYFDAGLFSVYKSHHLNAIDDGGTDNGYVGFEISRTKAIDVDDEEDWFILEALFEKLKRANI